MIITPESDLKDVKQLDVVVNRASVPDDPPPAYFRPESQTSVSAPKPPPAAAALIPPPPPDVKPTNFLSLSRGNSSIKGAYVIDPAVKTPLFMLPPLAADETAATRRNVFLHTSNGAIDVDLFVVGTPEPAPDPAAAPDSKRDGEKSKITVLLKSSNGSIAARIHAAPPEARAPLHLTAHTSNGSVTLHLPRAFRGPVTVRTRHGAVRLSDALAAQTTPFSEAEGTRRCFVGDFAGWEGEGEWAGDELSVETSNGSVRLQYDAEAKAAVPEGGKGKGLFGRLLGL
ncbi:hypothetical protein DFH09DRAFT_1183899 [Mycena vulgaris]|nr:hypothetical protein DFH09DRAFT_1183899 [Mycena vulgaris]